MKTNEILPLTGLRGIAAILVMLYHFSLNDLFTGPLSDFFRHGYLMVDLFLILSGFVLAMNYGEWFGKGLRLFPLFMFRRFARIYPLYAVMTLSSAWLIAVRLMDNWPGESLLITSLINLSLLQSISQISSLNFPAWSVSAEWIINLFFPWIVFMCLRSNGRKAAGVAVIAFLILAIIPFLPFMNEEPNRTGLLDIWHYRSFFPVLRCAADFILGVIAFRVYKLPLSSKFLGYSWPAPVIFTLLVILMCLKNSDLWIVLLFPFFLLSLTSEKNWVSRLMSGKLIVHLGKLSYSIYLLHAQVLFFMVLFSESLISLGVNSQLSLGVSLALFSLITCGLAQLSYRYIERPAQGFLNSKFVYNRQNANYHPEY